MQARYFGWIGVLLLLLQSAADARKINVVEPEDVEAKSTLICTGNVITNAYVGPNLLSVYTGGAAHGYRETWMSARVKVLHVFKGSAPAEIEVKYRVPQPIPNALLLNPPIHVRLGTGDRYRFFLKPDARPGKFVLVLDGQIDDAFAVQTLCPDEADDSPFLSGAEAIQTALDYLHRKKPGVPFDRKGASVFPEPGGMGDRVTLKTSFNSGAESATVMVLGNRQVDETESRLDERR